jgi:hypothetical protein
MEVLEHCPDATQVAVLDELRRVTTTNGTIVFSVPIEIGPTLLAKQCARALMAYGGLREYAGRERYRWGELTKMLWAGAQTAIPREEFPGPGETKYTGHKGFNWRRLQRMIEERFDLERRLFSPLPRLGSWLNSQVWFVCRKRPDA